jgi:hypothetical protein
MLSTTLPRRLVSTSDRLGAALQRSVCLFFLIVGIDSSPVAFIRMRNRVWLWVSVTEPLVLF